MLGGVEEAPRSDNNPFEALDTVSPLRTQQPTLNTQTGYLQTNGYHQSAQQTPVSPTNPFLQTQMQNPQVYQMNQAQQQYANPFQQYQPQQMSPQQQPQQQYIQQQQMPMQMQPQYQQPQQVQQHEQLQQQWLNVAPPTQQLSPLYGGIQPLQSQSTGNPFFSNPISTNPYMQTQHQQPSQQQPSFVSSSPFEHYQNVPQQIQPQHTQQPQQSSYGTQYLNTNPQTYTQAFQTEPQYVASQLTPQLTGRADKSTILALYNYPQFAPAPSSIQQPIPQEIKPPQRSVSAPVHVLAGSKNPFTQAAAESKMADGTNNSSNGSMLPPSQQATTMQTIEGTAKANGSRHMTQESVDFGGWQSGRHSPDAFASLSAKFRRL